MKYILLIFTLSVGLQSCNKSYNKVAIDVPNEPIELLEIQKWFDAWELVSTEILQLEAHSPPIMVFYDDTYVYSNSNLVIKKGFEFKGPKFFNKDINWLKTKHNDTLTLPTGDRIPVTLMSFAGTFENNNTSTPFFVMGTPTFWKINHIESVELGDKNLYTSVFLHEFSHTQQAKNFGQKLDYYEKEYDFKNDLNDDMIQIIFQKDSSYVESIQKEIETFYESYEASNEKDLIRLAKEGLTHYNKRQQSYFTDEDAIYKELDDFFLTMEGIGQYVSYAWLTHPTGAKIDKKTAIKGIRRNRTWWSQDEGFVLFLLYTKGSNPNLGKEMFGTDIKSIIQLLGDRFN